MKKLGRILRREEKGFTLIELIVVLAILAIIAAIAIPNFTGTLNNAKQRADRATAQTIADAAARYMTDNDGKAPDNGLTVSALQTANYLDNTVTINLQSQQGASFEIDNTPGTNGGTIEVKIKLSSGDTKPFDPPVTRQYEIIQ